MKIAVIGSGISGLSSAYYLSKKYKVDLFEQNSQLGGHSYTYDIKEKEKIVPVDLGFIVFNELTYSNLIKFFNELNVPFKLLERKIRFKTKSDTEVLVRYLETFGLKKTLKDLDGMWSFVWFLKKENKIYLGRDRYGEKPLYYFKDERKFIISSEIKAILLLTKKRFNLEKIPATNFLNYGIVNYDNKTLFSEIFQLPPSYYSVLSLKSKLNNKLFSCL